MSSGGVLQISSDRDRKIFRDLKFSISGFFWVPWFIAKFVVSRCDTTNLFCFCFVNQLSGDGVNANHNAKHSLSLACKNKTENDSRLLENSEGNRERETNKNDQKNLRRKLVDYCPTAGRSQAANLKTQKQTKWIEMHQSQVKMCFLRGPPRWLTEQKNPKFLWTLQNAQRDTKNLAISRDILGVFKTNLSTFRVISFYASWKFLLCLGNSAWDTLGDKFWSSDFFGFWFLYPFDIIPVTWNSEYPLWAWVKLKRTLNFSRFPSQVNLHFSDWKLCGGEQWKNQTFLKP